MRTRPPEWANGPFGTLAKQKLPALALAPKFARITIPWQLQRERERERWWKRDLFCQGHVLTLSQRVAHLVCMQLSIFATTAAATAVALLAWKAYSLRRFCQTAFTSARKYSTLGTFDGVTITEVPGVGLAYTPSAFSYKCALVYVPCALVEHAAYAPLCHAIARQSGCAVVLVQVPFRLAGMITASRRVSAAIRALPGVRRWFIGGHSMGGNFAASWLKANQGTMQGIIFHGAFSTAVSGESSLRYLSVQAEHDGLFPHTKAESAFSKLPPGSLSRVLVRGGNHAGFGHYGPQIFPKADGERTISLEKQQALVADATASWLAARSVHE